MFPECIEERIKVTTHGKRTFRRCFYPNDKFFQLEVAKVSNPMPLESLPGRYFNYSGFFSTGLPTASNRLQEGFPKGKGALDSGGERGRRETPYLLTYRETLTVKEMPPHENRTAPAQ